MTKLAIKVKRIYFIPQFISVTSFSYNVAPTDDYIELSTTAIRIIVAINKGANGKKKSDVKPLPARFTTDAARHFQGLYICTYIHIFAQLFLIASRASSRFPSITDDGISNDCIAANSMLKSRSFGG